MYEPNRRPLGLRKAKERWNQTWLDVRNSHRPRFGKARRAPPSSTRLADAVEVANRVRHLTHLRPMLPGVGESFRCSVYRVIPSDGSEGANQARARVACERLELALIPLRHPSIPSSTE